MERKRKNSNVHFETPCKKTKVLSLKEFSARSFARYSKLVKYPTLHKLSIVRQIIENLIDDVIFGGDTIYIDESCIKR